MRNITGLFILALLVLLTACQEIPPEAAEPTIRIEQITQGPDFHHFYGYIGHVGNTPWNRNGRYMAALRTTFDDHMPEPHESEFWIQSLDIPLKSSIRLWRGTRNREQ